MKTVFIYRPRGGDRVFIEKPGDQIRVVTWPNGCRHVQGDICHLRVSAAEPNRYWRFDAKQIATKIVEAMSGVGWDEQGTIHLVIPKYVGQWIARLLAECAKEFGDFHSEPRLAIQLLAQGIGMISSEQRRAIIPEQFESQCDFIPTINWEEEKLPVYKLRNSDGEMWSDGPCETPVLVTGGSSVVLHPARPKVQIKTDETSV